MNRRGSGRNSMGRVCPFGAAAPLRIVTAWVVILAIIGMLILPANAEEAEDSAGTAVTEAAAAEDSSGGQEVSISGTDEDSISLSEDSKGVHVTKSLTDNQDGTLQVELENYVEATAYTEIQSADIVLLLDRSGSMAQKLTSSVYRFLAMRDAAYELLDAILEINTSVDTGDGCRVAVVVFSSDVDVKYSFIEITADDVTDMKYTINTLGYYGGTYTDVAFETVQSALLDDETANRSRIVLFMTDGYPNGVDNTGTKQAGFVISVANRTLELAQAMKSAGTKIYCISIHPLADASYTELPTYEKIEEDCYFTELDEEAGDSGTVTTTSENAAALANRFMYLLSSCNPDALTVDDEGSTVGEDGESYYYTADTVDELIEAFLSVLREVTIIAADLDESAFVLDTIADGFTLTDASQISVYTSAYNGDGTWAERVDITDQVTVTVSGQQIKVSGFDYTANYVSDEPHDGTTDDYGKKLIVSFSITPSETFGGNQLATNGTDSGLYPGDGEDAAILYPVPSADVELDYEIGAEDRVVYVPDSIALEDLVLFEDGYVPDGSLNAHVDIVYTMTDEEGTVVGTLTIPAGCAAEDCSWEWETEAAYVCGTYLIHCDVSPVEEGHYDAISREASASVHVMFPLLTLQDTTQTVGETADVQPGDYTDESGLSDHYVSLAWSCADGYTPEDFGEETAAQAPILGYRLDLKGNVSLEEGQYVLRTEEDVPITVSVFRVSNAALAEDITAYTQFVHQCGRDDCEYDVQDWGDEAVRCLIHVDAAAETAEPEEEEEPAEEEEEPAEEEEEPEEETGDEEAEETEEETEEESDQEEEAEEEEETEEEAESETSDSEEEEETEEDTAAAETSAAVTQTDAVVAAAEEVVPAAEEAETVLVPAEEIAVTQTEITGTEESNIRSTAQTGDDAGLLLWAAAAVLSGAGLVFCLRLTRRRARR